MARKLTEPMKQVLCIMAEGHKVQWLGACYRYVPSHKSSVQGYTLYALRDRGLIGRAAMAWRDEDYRLTEAGRRAAEELA